MEYDMDIPVFHRHVLGISKSEVGFPRTSGISGISGRTLLGISKVGFRISVGFPREQNRRKFQIFEIRKSEIGNRKSGNPKIRKSEIEIYSSGAD